MPASLQKPALPKARETPGHRRRAGYQARPVPRGLRRCGCCRTSLGRLQIWLEGIDRYINCWIGIRAPQFAPIEDHRIEPLRVVALADRNRIREHVTAAAKFDHAELSAGVARQPRVRPGMDIQGAHTIADLESGRSLLLAEG